MNAKLEKLTASLHNALGDKIVKLDEYVGEITIELKAVDWLVAAKVLRDDPVLRFEQLTDLCGVDYSAYGEGSWSGKRFAAVTHLLSYANNQRLRVRVFAEDDEFPMLDSVVEVWPIANWNEREAFDLYGIVFTGHPDLRRILSDYGFIGHPFRKDFPLVGNVEMRYDPEQRRVVYQPTSMENRVMIPRVIREEGYGA
ncbi:MAG: NADH-quinone oxidoreductase subunit C [Sulfuricella sp.]|nr:NADH-quinone oxidoreductase subunit C [Sulfuricella sp.]